MDREPSEQRNGEPSNHLVASNPQREASAEELQKRMEHASVVLKNAMAELQHAGAGVQNPVRRVETAPAESWHFRDLVDGIDAVVWATNLEGHVLFVNRRAMSCSAIPRNDGSLSSLFGTRSPIQAIVSTRWPTSFSALVMARTASWSTVSSPRTAGSSGFVKDCAQRRRPSRAGERRSAA